MKHAVVPEPDQTDFFDRIPDPLVLAIFNHISDIKTLIRCRAVSRRLNSLVPQTDSLLLRVDRVISVTESDDEDSFFTFFRSIFKSIHDILSPKPLPNPIRTQNSPSRILRGFDWIRELEIELPSGDLRLEKGAVIKWKAVFGKSLKSCVILGFRRGGSGDGGGGGLKTRVVWTISALIAASARHYMVLDVVKEHKNLEKLVVKDREKEGMVVMDGIGLREFRENSRSGQDEEEQVSGNGMSWRNNNRTKVPSVRMRMRHEPVLELSNGVSMDGATVVIVRPIMGGGVDVESEGEEQSGDEDLVSGAFEGVYGEAVDRLLKSRTYLLEMNSF